VSLAIGTILLLGAMLVFEGSRESFTRQTATGGLQNEARYAMELIGRQIRETGYRSDTWLAGPIPNAVVAQNNATAAADGSGPDTLTVRYSGTADCAGAAPAPGAFVVNTFSLVGEQLQCNGVVVVQGVQDFQVFFGEDTDSDGVANRTVPPDAPGFNPHRVVFVRVHLLMLSDVTSVVNPRQQTYFYSAAANGAGATATVADGRIRREYVTTVAIRNPI
jgi:type IV pilus assembly protein PilW